MSAQKRTAGADGQDPSSSPAGEKVSPAPRRSARGSARPRSAQGDLGTELDQFIAAHPGGWNHDDWLGLLGNLRERGFETSDQDAIGLALEDRRRG